MFVTRETRREPLVEQELLLYFLLLLLSLGRTFACGLLVPEGIIHPVVNIDLLDIFIIEIYSL
jgi:hypothetical protein